MINSYIEDQETSSVTYLEDDNENVGLFFKVGSGKVIARYVIDFSTNLESDTTSANALDDIDDEEINIMGKTYTIITAVNSSATNTDLTLMSGANKVTINNGE